MTTRNLLKCALLSGAAFFITAHSVHAGGFALREQSVTGGGMSYAGAAAGSAGIGGIFWNPAIVTNTNGFNSEWNVFGITSNSQINNLVFTSGLGGGAAAAQAALPDPGQAGVGAILPSSYASYQYNDRVYFGLATTTPFGLGTSYNAGSSISFAGEESRIMTFNLNPIVGFKVSDDLSIAAGVQAQYVDVKLTQVLAGAFAGPPLSTSRGILEGDDYGIGFTLGALWKPLKHTTLGVGFRSAIFHELEGTQTLQATLPGPIPAGVYNITADVTTPEQVTVALRQEVTPDFSFGATVEWTNWSRLQTLTVAGSPTGAAIPFSYKDGLFYSLGADYRYRPDLTFRAGIGHELSPTIDTTRSARLPDNDRLWLSAGLSYDWNPRLKLSGSYSLVLVDDAPISGGAAGAPTFMAFTGTAETTLHIFGVSASYQWDPNANADMFAAFR